jgi:hypothetical protein
LGKVRAAVKRCLPAIGVLAAVMGTVLPVHEALAQAETPPQVLPSEDPSLGELLDQAYAAEPALAPDSSPARPLKAAILQGLNKTTARVSTIEAPIGSVARFGTLEITARDCEKKPPTETPESTAFLEIVDVRPDSPSVPVFTGWMFASSPAISALEHPVYDVWVIDCVQISGGDTAELPPGQEEVAPETQEPAVPR